MNRLVGQYFPSIEDRKTWSTLTEAARIPVHRDAEKLLGHDWPVLPAVRYMDYRRNGDRSRYEAVYFDRRRRVLLNVIAEAVEHKGRFLEEIVTGCWALCEETGWVVPAHNGPYRGDRYPELPDAREPIVDLFAAETGALLSATLQILGPILHADSGQVFDRMQYEISRRLITPFLERTDFWWMGFTPREPNNWNPWIVSNILCSICGLSADTVDVQAVVDKSLGCLGNFLNTYADDGGCDEGPVYWGHAAGSLFDAADILKQLTDGQVDLLSDVKVAEMGRYLYRVHIDHRWFVNYADGPAWNSGASPQLLYRYGKAISDDRLSGLGVFLHSRDDRESKAVPATPYPLRGIWAVLYERELSEASQTYAPLPDAWLPGIQVLTARSEAGQGRPPLFFSAKGGDNHESHNHNDVGSFVLFCGGEPVIIDPGVEQYTSKTFSDRRYEIWTMRSSYHNLPVINGAVQLPDSADDPRLPEAVQTSITDDLVTLSLDIAPTYPAGAGVESWIRSYRFHRPADGPALLEVSELPGFSKDGNTAELVFMTWGEPEVRTDSVAFRAGSASVRLDIVEQHRCRTGTVRVEPIAISDAKMTGVWGERIHRVVLPVEISDRDARLTYRFSTHPA